MFTRKEKEKKLFDDNFKGFKGTVWFEEAPFKHSILCRNEAIYFVLKPASSVQGSPSEGMRQGFIHNILRVEWLKPLNISC